MSMTTSAIHQTLLIVYHSSTGGAAQMAQAVLAGAQLEPQIQTRLLHASQAQPQDVLDADGAIKALLRATLDAAAKRSAEMAAAARR